MNSQGISSTKNFRYILTRVLDTDFCIHECRHHIRRQDRLLHTIPTNIRAQISKQDTFRSIEIQTSVPLQQKILFGEHEKHEKEWKNTKNIWIVNVFSNALYIWIFGYHLLSWCKTGIPNWGYNIYFCSVIIYTQIRGLFLEKVSD